MQRASPGKRRDWIDVVVTVILALSLISGFLLRTYRMDWDKGHAYAFHPDERAIVYSAINNISLPWPLDLPKLLRPDSPLNPHFFNYGNLPMYMIRATAHVLSFVVKNAWASENIWMAGRGLSAVFDILTIALAFLLGRKMYGRRVGLLAAVFGSFTVLHIQLAHFLTVDTFVTTFITLGMYFAIDVVRKGSLRAALLMGAALGLAMGSKVSVAPLAVSILVAWGVWAWRGSSEAAARSPELLTRGDRLAKAILGVLVASLSALVCFVGTMPYAIIDWTNFMRSVDEQSRMVRGIADFPYTRQYLNTPVFLYQVWNTAVWGMGLPLGIVAYAGFMMVIVRTLARRSSEEIVLLSWVAVYFVINGVFQVKFLRYMLPLFPFLAIMAADLLWQLWDWAGKPRRFSLRAFFRVPTAYAAESEEDDYLQMDAESEAWEREKRQRAGAPAKSTRLPPASAGRRRPRQLSIGAPRAEEPPAPRLEEAAPTAEAPAPRSRRRRPVPPSEPEAAAVPVVPVAAAPAAKPRPRRTRKQPEFPPPTASAPPLEQAAPEQPAVDETAPASIEPPSARFIEPSSSIAEAGLTAEVEPAPASSLSALLAQTTRAQVAVAALIAFVVLSTVFYALAFMNIYRQPHPWVAMSEWIYRNVPAGTTAAIEHWDDALPLGRRIDGRQRLFEEYKHVEMKNYEDDNQAKLEMFVSNIQKSDYIVLATNRLYGTIARLPERYPVSARYYELLFAERLGFKLVAYNAVYPSLLGVTIMSDTLVEPALPRPALLAQKRPGGLVINLGKADESFTVYDHPLPLLFQKVEQIPESDLRAMFAGTVQKFQEYQQNRQAQRAASRPSRGISKSLLLTPTERDAQEAGGTYVELFDPDGLPNRLPVIFWWLAVQIIALAAVPITFVVFASLRDRGYLLSKTLGLVLVAYLPWLAASYKIVPFGRISIIVSIAVLLAVSLLIIRRRQGAFLAWLRRDRWLILVGEVVFSLAFLAFVYVRMLNPDLWQPWNGGEKPMEFGFLSAIARSTYFPPYDPFFAGGFINYYYYGYYICAMLIRLVGVEPAIGFNLVIPLLFALTVANAFSITFNLVAGLRKAPAPPPRASWQEFAATNRSFIGWALAGALFVVVIGNLATVGEVFKGPWNRGATTVQSSIPGLSAVVRVADGLVKSLRPGQRVFEPLNYWNPSRVIPDTINEFPFWSYMFADLHPHTIGIPFTLLVLALALSLLSERRQLLPRAPVIDVDGEAPRVRALSRLFGSLTAEDVLVPTVLGLSVGVLGAINTWDLPTYMGVVLAAIVLHGFVQQGRINLADVVVRFGVVALLSMALYLPFYQNYEALVSGIGLVRSRTPVGYYLAIYGLFLFSIMSYIVVDVLNHRRATAARLVRLFTRYFDDAPLVWHRLRAMVKRRSAFSTSVAFLVLLIVVLVLLALLKQGIIVLLLPLVVVAVARGISGERSPERVFVWLLVFVGMLISLGIEILFLRDWLQGGSAYRMNTLFKFGIEIWILLALASAAGLAVVWHRIVAGWSRIVSGRLLWIICLALLAVSAFLFPVIGTVARVNDRFPGDRPPVGTLDGTAFMTVGRYTFDWERRNIAVELRYDHEALQWLLRNVKGSPVIAEAVLPYYRELGARVSAYTGLPTLVGNQHAQEQRPGDTQVGPRENEARTLYNDPSFDNVIPLLKKHRVRYIYVGQLEQAIYQPAGLAKFDRAVGVYLELVFENAKTRIYMVKDP